MKGKDTLREIRDQPGIWAEVIATTASLEAELDRALTRVDGIILTGCGSALNVAFAAAPILQRFTGIDARAIPAADMFQIPEACIPRNRKTLVVTISRSGETTETVLARRAASERSCTTLSLTCFESTMSREADISVVLACCQEKSVCTTHSVTGMLLALQWMAAIHDKNFRAELERLPELGEKLIPPSTALGEMLGNDDLIEKYAFIGSGPFYGIARECQLKIKEMTLLPSDSYPLMDYRHGPKSNIDVHMLISMLCSDSGRLWERECADDLMRYGGQLLVISNSPVLGKHTSECYLHCNLSEYARGPLYLPIVQSMAATKALRLGMDPDNPKNLSYWVETKVLQ